MLNLSSKPLTILLSFLLLFLQYELWSTNGGLSQVWRTKVEIEGLKTQTAELEEKNMILAADVEDLKQGDEALEERARMDLGMVKQNETFYQIID